MKILLLSCNTGQGHNTAAKALLEELQRREIACELKDALAFSSEMTSRLVSNTYMRMATDAPAVFGKLYQVSSLISSPRVKSPVYYANMAYTRALGRYIRENGFDAVITSHLFPAQALTHLRHRKQLSCRTYLVGTDYTCHPFSEETDMDAIFIAHPELIDEYIARGVPGNRLVPTGIPVSARFRADISRKEARETLGIGRDERVFLIMTGSMGFGGGSSIAEDIIRDAHAESRIFIMTGRNEELKRKIDALHEKDERIIAVGFTDQVPLYMRAANVLLTKPGGLTTTEAAVARIPIVHSAPIPGCETANVRFFEYHGMSVCADQDAARAALWLAADREKCQVMMDAQKKYINPHATSDICDWVIRDLAEQA